MRDCWLSKPVSVELAYTAVAARACTRTRALRGPGCKDPAAADDEGTRGEYPVGLRSFPTAHDAHPIALVRATFQ